MTFDSVAMSMAVTKHCPICRTYFDIVKDGIEKNGERVHKTCSVAMRSIPLVSLDNSDEPTSSESLKNRVKPNPPSQQSTCNIF